MFLRTSVWKAVTSLKPSDRMRKSVFSCVSDEDPADLSHLSRKEFWDRKYDRDATQQAFEWLTSYKDFGHVLEGVLPDIPQHTFLDLGCGISRTSLDLVRHQADRGRTINVFLLDYSSTAVEFQRDLFSKELRLTENVNEWQQRLLKYAQFVQGDATALPFNSSTFDVILDKGTLDSMLKDLEVGSRRAERVVLECHRVLRPGGILCQVTDEDPDLRLPLLNTIRSNNAIHCSVTFKCLTEDDTCGYEYFMYIVRKNLK